MSTTTWTMPMPYGRMLDPVRAAALHEAVQVWHSGAVEDDGSQLDLILKTAKRFEDYLAGEKAP